MIIVTTNEVPGREITDVVGLVRGTTVRARNVFKDVRALFRNVVGGELPGYTKLVAESREQAIDRMVAEARAGGADAIVAFRFATSEVARSAAEVVAYGTAVRLRSR